MILDFIMVGVVGGMVGWLPDFVTTALMLIPLVGITFGTSSSKSSQEPSYLLGTPATQELAGKWKDIFGPMFFDTNLATPTAKMLSQLSESSRLGGVARERAGALSQRGGLSQPALAELMRKYGEAGIGEVATTPAKTWLAAMQGLQFLMEPAGTAGWSSAKEFGFGLSPSLLKK